MKYMLLIYGAEGSWTEEEREGCMVESMGIGDELAARGKYLGSAPLEPVATAATVRVRDGQAMVIDGPFAETTEQLGGFYILELEDLDEAIAVASRLPPAKKGTVEIRPVFELDGLPPSRPIPGGPAESGPGRPFMLLCYDDEGAWREAGAEALRSAMAEASGLARELSEAGRFVEASPLHPSELATCVRVRDGLRQVTDGPFAETNEVLGGYYIIVARSRDEALQVASRHPGARFGSVEVRPIFDVSALREAAPIS